MTFSPDKIESPKNKNGENKAMFQTQVIRPTREQHLYEKSDMSNRSKSLSNKSDK